MALMIIRTGYISKTIARRRIEFVRTQSELERYAAEIAAQGVEPQEERVEICKARTIHDLLALEAKDKQEKLIII